MAEDKILSLSEILMQLAIKAGSRNPTVINIPYSTFHYWADKVAKLEQAVSELGKALEIALGAVEYMASATDADPEDHERLALVQRAIAKAKGFNLEIRKNKHLVLVDCVCGELEIDCKCTYG